MANLTHRSEILFIYEARDCNPNGDPLDENRPRIDPDTGVLLVTDARIKRVIRDFFIELEPDTEKRLMNGREILIRESYDDDLLRTSAERLMEFVKKKGDVENIQQYILEKCIDARFFGMVLAAEGLKKLARKKEKEKKKKEAQKQDLQDLLSAIDSNGDREKVEHEGNGGKIQDKEETSQVDLESISIKGAVQFSALNRSLHRVSVFRVQQTGAFLSKSGNTQRTWAERWLTPYAIIAAYGEVNESQARKTGMSAEDVELLWPALWRGTLGLSSTSKFGHAPLLLVVADYMPGYRLGALPQRIRLSDQRVEETALRSTADFTLDVTDLLNAWRDDPHLQGLRIQQDPRLRCRCGEACGDFLSLAGQSLAGKSVAALGL